MASPLPPAPVCSQRAVPLKVGHLAAFFFSFISFGNIFFFCFHSCSAHEAEQEAPGNSTETGIYSHGAHTKPSNRCCINRRCKNRTANTRVYFHLIRVPWLTARSSAAWVMGQRSVPSPRLPVKIHVVMVYLWQGLLWRAPVEQPVSSKKIIAHSCILYMIFQLKAEVYKIRGFGPYFGHLCA